MTLDEFWTIVDRAHAAAPNDMKEKCRVLGEELRRLTPDDILSFEIHFADAFFHAYNWNLWAAAVIINGGCGDDGFMDFRSALVSLGRSTFENAVADPETLAELSINPDWACYEGYQYVAAKVFEEIGGKEIPDESFAPHPEEPTGTSFQEWELEARFPKLCAKFGHKDSSWFTERDRQKRAEETFEKARRLGELWLNAKIIPSSGLIPPFKLLIDVMRSGKSPEEVGTEISWMAFELDQEAYWPAIGYLESLSKEKLKAWPHLRAQKLQLDISSNQAASFSGWLRKNS